MTSPMFRKLGLLFITLHCSLTLILLHSPLAVAAAPQQVRLIKAVKSDSEAEARIIIEFSAPPAYRLQSSGKQVDLRLRNVATDPGFKELAADSSLVKMQSKRSRQELTLSFLLNRAPQRVDSFFTMHNSQADRGPGDKTGRVQLVLVLPWSAGQQTQALPDKAAHVDDTATPSQPLASPAPEKADRTLAGRQSASAYKGQGWWKFFEDYEAGVTFPPVMRYSLPPFPCRDILANDNTAPEEQGLAASGYQEALRQGKAGEWRQAVATIEAAIKALGSSPAPASLMLLYGEVLLHAGAFDQSHELLATLAASGRASAENLCARYLAPLSQAAAGQPYDATYAINELHKGLTEANPLTPHLQLLKAEIALVLGRGQEALRLLGEHAPAAPGAAHEMYLLRQADGLAATGRSAEALQGYRQIAAQSDLLRHQPFSLAQAAGLLYASGEFGQALPYYTDLATELPAAGGRDLALFRSAMCDLRAGQQEAAMKLITGLINDLPGSEGSFRARLKQADLHVLAEATAQKKMAAGEVPGSSPVAAEVLERRAIQEKYLPGSTASQPAATAKPKEASKTIYLAGEYAALATQAPSRELRDEAAFKEILVSCLQHDLVRAADLLRDFLRNNRSSRLYDMASVLQVELVPEVIKDQTIAGDPLFAMTLVEQNRPLLASGQVSSDFLAELGLAFAGLYLWNRAIKVYLYMLDLARNKAEEEKVIRPLIEALLANGDYDEVEKRATAYERHFPAGQERGAILCLRLEALKRNNQIDRAAKLLKAGNLPENRELNLFAGRLFFERGEYDEAEKFLAKAIGGDLAKASPEVVLIRAEALYRGGNTKAALPLYQHLRNDAACGDQAVYRLAQIELATPDSPAGLKLLQDLVEKARSPLWRRLAAETLAEGRL